MLRRLVVVVALAFAVAEQDPQKQQQPTLSEREYELINACADGKTETVRRLLAAGVSADAATPDGESALHVAGIAGNPDVVKLLVTAGADLDRRVTAAQGLHMTPLTWFCYGAHVAGATALLDAGAKPDLVVVDERGARLTALDIAADRVKDDALVDALRAAGARRYADLSDRELDALLPAALSSSSSSSGRAQGSSSSSLDL